MEANTSLKPSFPGKESQAEGPAVPENSRGFLHLFTFGSPMGRKCQIVLEVLRELYGEEVSWTWELVPLPKRIQKSSWYLKLNPDGRIPLLVDRNVVDPSTGRSAYLRESGAILLHLVERYDQDHKVTFQTAFERQDMLAWIMFGNSAVGPAQAVNMSMELPARLTRLSERQSFLQFKSDRDVPIGRELFVNEVHRLYQILEDRLSGTETGSGRDWLAGVERGKFSLADIDLFPWIYIHAKFGIMTTEEFTTRYVHMKRWLDRCWAREAVRRGIEGYDA